MRPGSEDFTATSSFLPVPFFPLSKSVPIHENKRLYLYEVQQLVSLIASLIDCASDDVSPFSSKDTKQKYKIRPL